VGECTEVLIQGKARRRVRQPKGDTYTMIQQ